MVDWNNPEEVRAYRKVYRELNHAKICLDQKRYYLENKEKIKEYQGGYRDCNRELVNKNQKRYYHENTDRAMESQSKYYNGNRDKIRHMRAMYRARKRGAVGWYTLDDWQKLLDVSGGVCPSCKMDVGVDSLTRDHIIPVSKGGSNWLDNIQPLCHSCNCSKNDLHCTNYLQGNV